MTGRQQSIPLAAIKRHTTLQNRNTSAGMRWDRQEAEQRVAHIARLAQSIEIIGQEKPLELVAMTESEVKATGQHYWLVGGHHRLAALELLKREEATAIILKGCGLNDARSHSYLQNAELFRQLGDDQRIANTWRAMNDPGIDTFRSKTNQEMAATFNITTRTIDRMREVRRRWAARMQSIDYEAKRAQAKEQGQRGIRAFNLELDDYCDRNLMQLYMNDYGHLKRELGRGTTEATLEERQRIARTVPAVLQMLDTYGLYTISSLRSVIKHVDSILAEADSLPDACNIADARYMSNASANMEAFTRSQEVAPLLHLVHDPLEVRDY